MGKLWFSKKEDSNKSGTTPDPVSDAKLVLDLDQLMPKPIAVAFNGERHLIYPVTVGQFAETYDKVTKVDEAVKNGKVDQAKIPQLYADAFRTVCPTMTEQTIQKMTKDQCQMFFMLIYKVFSGEAFKMEDLRPGAQTEEKKTPQAPPRSRKSDSEDGSQKSAPSSIGA